MFGYACNETPELMPSAIIFAHRILRKLAALRKSKAVDWLRPDAKSQVCIAYEDGKITHIDNVVVSTQHKESVKHKEIYDFIVEQVIKKVLPHELLNGSTQYLINPTGKFVIGGPAGDAGLTGRKIIVDTYGGWGRHGGGAFSGKDPSKVDRSAAYMCRWVAKNVVAAGLADICELQVAYAIGYPNPTSIHIETFDTGKFPDLKITEAVKKVFNFKPAEIIDQLDLLRPIFRASTHYGHFGKPEMPWEQTDKVKELQEAAK
jgi:S-adenosylmethionine synthetase